MGWGLRALWRWATWREGRHNVFDTSRWQHASIGWRTLGVETEKIWMRGGARRTEWAMRRVNLGGRCGVKLVDRLILTPRLPDWNFWPPCALPLRWVS
jgi:hypothetical protein